MEKFIGKAEVLMEALGRGSLAAFQALYDRHHRAVYTFLLRSLGDRQVAEDILRPIEVSSLFHSAAKVCQAARPQAAAAALERVRASGDGR